MNKIDEKLESIELDNKIFVTIIIVALVNLSLNKKLKDHFLYNIYSLEELRKEYTLTSSIILYIFFINLKRNLDEFEKDDLSFKEKELIKLRIYASYLFIFAQLIGIYYIINTENLSDEVI